MSTAAAT